MKTIRQISFAVAIIAVFSIAAQAQFVGPAPLVVPGNNYAFAYTTNGAVSGITNFGLYFKETGAVPGFEYRNGTGGKLLTVSSIPSGNREAGDITFGPTGSLIIQPNRYAFRYSVLEGYGLFFNAADIQYEFRTANATPVLSIQADDGNVEADGYLLGNGSALLGDFGVKGSGGNGPTNGYLGVNGGTDFDGEDSLDISGTEIGVLGVSTGGSSVDNTGVYGFSNGVGVAAHHETAGTSVELATASTAISATGEVEIVANASNSTTSQGSLRLSSTFGSGIAFDNNDVQSYTNATTAGGTFYVNFYGGNVDLCNPFGGDGDLNVHGATLYMDGLDNEVGIGTAGPSAKLDVVGNTELNGELEVSNSSTGRTADIISTASGSIGQTFNFEKTQNPSNANDLFQLEVPSTSPDGFQFIECERGFDVKFQVDGDGDMIIDGQGSKPGGGLWAASSDRRLKKDIQSYDDGLEMLMQINPVTFKYNELSGFNNDDKEYVGVIAQEIEKIAPYMIESDRINDGNDEGISGEEYLSFDGTAIIYMLVNSVKEQQSTIEELKEEVVQLKSDLSSCCVGMKSEGNVIQEKVQMDGPWLGQNIPNPFNNSTVIQYYTPESVSRSEIRVFDLSGKEIKSFTLEKGYGEVKFNDMEISAGTYVYTLINDDTVIATKKMILNR